MGDTVSWDDAVPLLSLSHVRFSYQGQLAVDDASLAVEEGETVTLVGPNGCGKSTILRLCVGLELPSAGDLRFRGKPVNAQTMRDQAFAKSLRQQVGFVFQDSDVQLFCPTVRDEIAFGPQQMGLEPHEVATRVDDCLRLLGIEALVERTPYQLSGGEKKRVALASVLSMGPRLLLLDEPTNALDEEGAERVVALLRSYVASGHAVLMTTHHRDLVDALGARVVHMNARHRTV